MSAHPAASTATAHGPLRIAVLGAFAFPLARGSQVFARDHARALRAAGAELLFFCYGRGQPGESECFEIERIARWLSPRALGSGPSLGKPLADLALARRFARAHARRGFDVAIAHNAEAAAAALLARARTRVPVIYLAHTLLGSELACYSPPRFARALDALGRGVDGWLARRCDGVIALGEHTARELARLRSGDAGGRRGRSDVVSIAPGLAPRAAPSLAEIERACARHGLERGCYAIYAGNLDAYQNLAELAEVARAHPELPIVAATAEGESARSELAGLRIARSSAEEARALCFGAALAVAPRRLRGGFPIKLLNYMEAGLPIVCRAGLADSLVHARSAWLISDTAGPRELGDAMQQLARERTLARELGRGARHALLREHAWPALAARTLSYADRLRRAARPALAHAAAALSLGLAVLGAGCAHAPAEPTPEPAAGTPAPVFDARLDGARATRELEALAASAALAPDQAIAVRELGRDADASHHLVTIRGAETPHRHDRHAITVVLVRGHGSMLIGTEERPVGPGSILYVPRATRHAFRNRSPEPAVAFVMYVPPLEGADRVDDPLPVTAPAER
jgi:mannose-6-phosphate isomerase-like protein (cupin superfamily)/glycosyltransferase involved in cell wall biosynthesis